MSATPQEPLGNVTEILVNRAPFLTLWASIVARRRGFDSDEALTLGRAVAGQTAAAKATRLGIAERQSADGRRETAERRRRLGAEDVHLMGRTIPCLRTQDGLRALADTAPIEPASVQRYLVSKFKEHLGLVELRLSALAAAYEPTELDVQAMDLYMKMRPATAAGKAGWGQAGRLDLNTVDRLLAGRAR